MGRQLTARNVLALAAVFLLIALPILHPSVPGHAQLQNLADGAFGTVTAPQPFRHSHIVVASDFGSHFDVYMAFVWTMRKVLGSEGHVKVYASHPFGHRFDDIIDRLGLYNGTYSDRANLISDLGSANLYPDEPGAKTDMVVLGTCEIDMKRWSEQLLQVYDSQPEGEKFKLVCIVHNVGDTAWQVHITPWARRGAVRILPISEHVAKAFRLKFSELADNPDPAIYGSGYEYIPVDVHVPILPLWDPEEKSPSATLSNAVIQGGLTIHRRDYLGIFADLQRALEENPKVWGYKPLASPDAVYEPDLSAEHPPFVLHLMGRGKLDVPHNISSLVLLHTGLDYADFYDLMHEMDVVIPAFKFRGGYYDAQASSTMAMAVECNAPILVTNHIRATYTYAADDRIIVTRPQAMREIEAIKILRTGVSSPPSHLGDDAARQFDAAAQKMREQGWRRTNQGFAEVKNRIWSENEDVARRVLNDL